MISYEVSVTVRLDHCELFEAYMRDRHIPDVMATGSFASASLECAAPGRYRTVYLAKDKDSLDNYFESHAAGLRDDFAMHFPTGVEVSRTEWEVLKRFP